MPTAKPGAKTKVCSKCKKRKALSCFNAHPNTRDRLKSQCKDCSRDCVYALRERTGNAYGHWYQTARGRAERRLVAAHPDEFEALFSEELASLPEPQYERKNASA